MKKVSNDKEMLKEALRLYVEESTEEYTAAEQLDTEFSQAFEKNMERFIKRRRRPFFYIFNTAAKRVACLMVALIIVVAGAAVGVSASPENKGYKIKNHRDSTEIIFITNGNEPNSIETYYGPSYIPEGYELSDTKRSYADYSVEYENAHGDTIRFHQGHLGGGTISVFVDRDRIEELEKGVFFSVEKDKTFFFSDGKYQYRISVYGDISKEEILKIADSLEDMHFVGPF